MRYLTEVGLYIVVTLSIFMMQCEKSEEKIIIEEDFFSGIIFTHNFSYTYSDGETLRAIDFITGEPKGVWTPSYNDILKLERNLDDLNRDTLQFKNLENYRRQYIGFIDETEEKNIWINLLSLEHIEENIDIVPIITHDTDSSVFTINYSLADSSFFDLRFY